MIIDGKAISADILAATKQRVAAFGRTPVVRAITVAPNAATESYLGVKSARAADAGMRLEVVQLSNTASTEDVIAVVQKEGADAVIVQLPLPEHFDTTAIVNSIPIEKDADVLSGAAYTRFEKGDQDAILPPVAATIGEILRRSDIEAVTDKRVVIIGRGKLVGKPVAAWFVRQGARPEIIDRTGGSLVTLKDADIIVSGAGSPHLIKPEMLKPGVILIDAGTSESNGALAGDADPSCAEIASVFTPVPGGVGPIAVACLFRNAVLLVERAVAK